VNAQTQLMTVRSVRTVAGFARTVGYPVGWFYGGLVLRWGVDRAAAAVGTAIARIDWSATRAHIRQVVVGAGDDAVVDAIRLADNAGVDCPLGWPARSTGRDRHPRGRCTRLVVVLDPIGRHDRSCYFWSMVLVKGTATRAAIVDEALRQTAREGLAGVTFGVLADSLGLSKSGLFAHFKAKEALQLAVLEEAGVRFRKRVVTPALTRPPGRQRLITLFSRYLDWMGRGCVYSTIAQEVDKLPESVGQAFRDGQRRWQLTIGDVAADVVGPQQIDEVSLQFVGLALAYQQAVKVFADCAARRRILKTFEHILETTT
jgi:AcrR family transcriptional regulator